MDIENTNENTILLNNCNYLKGLKSPKEIFKYQSLIDNYIFAGLKKDERKKYQNITVSSMKNSDNIFFTILIAVNYCKSLLIVKNENDSITFNLTLFPTSKEKIDVDLIVKINSIIKNTLETVDLVTEA